MNHKIRVSARAIIIKDHAILLVDFGNGQYYNFIGGGIEKGETAKQAVIREAIEEAGISVTVGELVFSFEYEPESCEHLYGDGHHISFFFRCYADDKLAIKPTQPDFNPDDPSIRAVAKWIPLDKINEINLVPKVQKQLLEYASTGKFTPSFWAEDEQMR